MHIILCQNQIRYSFMAWKKIFFPIPEIGVKPPRKGAHEDTSNPSNINQQPFPGDAQGKKEQRNNHLLM